MSRLSTVVAGVLLAIAATSAAAQPMGTFRWQLRPYCNVITVTVTRVGAFYRLEGTDDRCGAADASSVIGTAFVNPDGSIGMGFNVVVAPGGVLQPVAAQVSLATLGGTWSDAQYAGQFVFTPGAGTGGSPRPVPATGASIADAFRLQADGGFLAGGTFPNGTIPASGPGVRLMWTPAKAAIRAGRVTDTAWDDAGIGAESAAFNRGTQATGLGSFAVNDRTRAVGASSAAFGISSQAIGANSLAAGESVVAAGLASLASGTGASAGGAAAVALGAARGNAADALAIGAVQTVASGLQGTAFGGSTASANRAFAAGASITQGETGVALASGTAFGTETVALGDAAAAARAVVAIGYATTATNQPGTFYYGDRSTSTPPVLPPLSDQFVVRATGDVGFYTNAAATTGVELAGGGGSWAPLSDARMKRGFRDVAGADLLRRLARVPVREWNYVTQDASIRHLGPTAQDFRAAFGLGDHALRINTIDADGVALAAARALATRTRDLAERQSRLADEHDRLRARHAALLRERRLLGERLTRLEAELESRPW